MALIFTVLSGLFFLIGIVISKFVNNKVRLTRISVACASIVLVGLILFDLLPELIEKNVWYLYIFIVVGFALLLLLDKLVPHHNHHHHENDEATKDHQDHLEHVSTITMIALLLHNAIEGMALYSVTLSSVKSGALMLLGIGLHNLPFGFQIGSYNKKNNKFLVSLLVLSGFIGGLIFNLFGSINELLEGAIIAVTLGMLLHILLFELLNEVLENIKKKETIYGIIIGIILLIVINLV